MKSQKRAIRRHHRARLIKKYMMYEVVRWRTPPGKDWSWNDYDTEENRKRNATLLVNHIAICSCGLCRNERRNPWLKKHDTLTIPEKKEEDRYQCDLLEVDILDDITDNDDLINNS